MKQSDEDVPQWYRYGVKVTKLFNQGRVFTVADTGRLKGTLEPVEQMHA